MGNLTVTNCYSFPNNLMPKKYSCIASKESIQPRFESVKECPFSSFSSVHPMPFKMCRLQFRFQNLLSSKSIGKVCAVFVLSEGLSVALFTVFKICQYRMNAVEVSFSPLWRKNDGKLDPKFREILRCNT